MSVLEKMNFDEGMRLLSQGKEAAFQDMLRTVARGLARGSRVPVIDRRGETLDVIRSLDDLDRIAIVVRQAARVE